MLDDVPTNKIAEFESGLYRHLESGFAELLPTIAKDKVLSDETVATLEKAIGEYKRQGGFGATDDAAPAAEPSKADDGAGQETDASGADNGAGPKADAGPEANAGAKAAAPKSRSSGKAAAGVKAAASSKPRAGAKAAKAGSSDAETGGKAR